MTGSPQQRAQLAAAEQHSLQAMLKVVRRCKTSATVRRAVDNMAQAHRENALSNTQAIMLVKQKMNLTDEQAARLREILEEEDGVPDNGSTPTT